MAGPTASPEPSLGTLGPGERIQYEQILERHDLVVGLLDEALRAIANSRQLGWFPPGGTPPERADALRALDRIAERLGGDRDALARSRPARRDVARSLARGWESSRYQALHDATTKAAFALLGEASVLRNLAGSCEGPRRDECSEVTLAMIASLEGLLEAAEAFLAFSDRQIDEIFASVAPSPSPGG